MKIKDLYIKLLEYGNKNPNGFDFNEILNSKTLKLKEWEKTIIEKYNIDPDKITVIHLNADERIKKSKGLHDIKLPKQFLFYPAALWPHKNHKILIEILNELKNEFQNLHLVLTGVIKKEKLKEEIDDLIKQYGLSEKVSFLGYVSDENLDLIYQKAQMLVFPSSFEGFGIPIIEAFRNKLPVIAADNTSITEVVGNAGLLFETNNKEECREYIEKVLTDKNLKYDLIEKGLKRAENFSWEINAKETLRIFNNI